jgi:hypothetical protein
VIHLVEHLEQEQHLECKPQYHPPYLPTHGKRKEEYKGIHFRQEHTSKKINPAFSNSPSYPKVEVLNIVYRCLLN